MVFFNWATMQMAAKIVYYGPGLCGKTSNLSYIYAKTTPSSRGEMVSLETESDRTLFFDLLPIEVGTIGGFKTRLQLYTVPGQVFYNTTRKLVLKGVDGLVFVADSQRPMREANVESFTSLVNNLDELGLDMADLPLVLQYNKRDLKNILTVDELNTDLNPHAKYIFHEASAIHGDGVFETLKEITKLTLKKLRKRMAASQPGSPAPSAGPVRPVIPSQRPESISAAALARAAEEGVVSNHASNPTTPAPVTPTRIAPPMPASPPRRVESDVFSAADDDAVAPPVEGPLGGVVDLPSMEVTAPELSVPTDAGVGADAEPADAEASGDPAENIEFAQQPIDDPISEPPPMKRVHVSNQLDILAELESLRASSLSGASTSRRRSTTSEIDIDSLISDAMSGTKKLRRRIDARLAADVFRQMRSLEVAVRVKNAKQETIHTIDPVTLEVDDADGQGKLAVRFAIDLEKSG